MKNLFLIEMLNFSMIPQKIAFNSDNVNSSRNELLLKVNIFVNKKNRKVCFKPRRLYERNKLQRKKDEN